MRGKHWYYFGEESVSKFQNLSNNSNSLNQETWDILRIDDVSSPFAIENTKKEYESNCLSKTDYIEAAELIGKELNEVGGYKYCFVRNWKRYFRVEYEKNISILQNRLS